MKNDPIIVAVFGISGVGKSTLIQRYINDNAGWVHLQAGSLIKAASPLIVDRDSLRLQGVEGIMANQNLMIGKFWEEIAANTDKNVIFDGHSVIDTTDHGLLTIPTKIIAELKPTALVFVQAHPKIIQDRRSQGTDRKRPHLSLEELDRQQKAALQQARIYSEELQLDLHLLENPTDVEFDQQMAVF